MWFAIEKVKKKDINLNGTCWKTYTFAQKLGGKRFFTTFHQIEGLRYEEGVGFVCIACYCFVVYKSPAEEHVEGDLKTSEKVLKL